MICEDIITKDKMNKCLSQLIMNTQALKNLSTFFENDFTIEQQNKIMYLLYNEYFGIDILGLSKNEIETKIKSIELAETNIFETPYYYIKKLFIRDYIQTLSFSNYKNTSNIINQMKLVDASLTTSERTILKTLLKISEDTVDLSINLIRYPDENGIINMAICEGSNFLSIFSENLNNSNKSALISIFNKIRLGTIH